MTYEVLVKEMQELFGKADVSGIKEHIAYQFNIEGEAAGAFYAEVSEGKLTIAPYEYFDRDVLFTTTAEVLLQIVSGNADPVAEFTLGRLKVEGNFDKALMLSQFAAGQKDAEAENKPKTVKKTSVRKTQKSVKEPAKKAASVKASSATKAAASVKASSATKAAATAKKTTAAKSTGTAKKTAAPK